MAPFSFLFVALALVSSHGVFGAPSCSTDLSSCTSKCKAKWYHHSMMSHAPQSSPVGGAKPTYPAGDYPKESPVSSPATQPMPTSTPPAPSSSHPATPSPSSNGSSGATSSSDIAAYLKAHNDFRALHGASALTWSDELASTALAWGKGCKFEHSHGQYGGTYLLLEIVSYLKPVAENLAAGTGALSIQDAVNMWTAEESELLGPHLDMTSVLMYFVIQRIITPTTRFIRILRRSSGRRPPSLAVQRSPVVLGRSSLPAMECVHICSCDGVTLMVLFRPRVTSFVNTIPRAMLLGSSRMSSSFFVCYNFH